MSAPVTARHHACDGNGCEACRWTGAPPADAATLACPACRREWRACVCVGSASDDEVLDVAAGYVAGAERRADGPPVWTVTAPLGSPSFGLPDYGTAFAGGRRRAGR